MALTRLSDWEAGRPTTVTATKDPTIHAETPPLGTVFAMDAATFFARAADLLAKDPGYVFDRSSQLRLARIGFVAGLPFDLGGQPPEVRQGLASALPAPQHVSPPARQAWASPTTGGASRRRTWAASGRTTSSVRSSNSWGLLPACRPRNDR